MRPPKGGPIGANGDEQEGVGAGRGAGACAEWAAAVGGRGSAAPAELSADEAVMEALPGGRGGRAEAPQRGAAFAPSVRGEVPREGVGAGAREVRRAGGRAFRSDASRRALGFGGRAAGRCRDVAAVDAGRRVVEPGAKATAASAKARAQGTLWRAGANGRELSPLAGGAGSARVLDGLGGRRHQ